MDRHLFVCSVFSANIPREMAVRGYLTVVVTQASSRTKANEVVWDDNFTEGFVKGEIDAMINKSQLALTVSLLCS